MTDRIQKLRDVKRQLKEGTVKLDLRHRNDPELKKLAAEMKKSLKEFGSFNGVDGLEMVKKESSLSPDAGLWSYQGKKVRVRAEPAGSFSYIYTIMKEEAEEINEKVEIRHDRFIRSHGKKAKGNGNWMFTTKSIGSPSKEEIVSARGTLAAAAKEAADKLGSTFVYVMEEVEDLDEEKAITVKELKAGRVYTLEDEEGVKFKAEVKQINKIRGGRHREEGYTHEVVYTYVDNSYMSKNRQDVFHVKPTEKVFYEAVGVKSAEYDKLDKWEERAKAKGYKVTKNNKSGTYYAWKGTDVIGSFNAHGKFFGGRFNEATSYDKDLDPNKKIVARGVKGMKSKPFTKKFKNMAAYDKWTDSDEYGDYDVQQLFNEAKGSEFKTKNFATWKFNAISRGYIVRLMTHPEKGVQGLYYTAKDMQGNFRGEYFVDKKEGVLVEDIIDEQHQSGKQREWNAAAAGNQNPPDPRVDAYHNMKFTLRNKTSKEKLADLYRKRKARGDEKSKDPVIMGEWQAIKDAVVRVFKSLKNISEHHIKPGTTVTAKEGSKTIKGKVLFDTSDEDGTDNYQYVLNVGGKRVSVSNKSIQETKHDASWGTIYEL